MEEIKKMEEMESRFNSGDLSMDINNIAKEIDMLQKLQRQKQHLKKKIFISNQEKKAIENTLVKVQEMISQGISVQFDKQNCNYINDIYGLKKFYIELNVEPLEKYNSCRGTFTSFRQKNNRILSIIETDNEIFGTITSAKPYETQFNVTRMEYEYTVNLLQDLLPIDVTVKRSYEESIIFNVSCDYSFIYFNNIGNAYISGISLNGRHK